MDSVSGLRRFDLFDKEAVTTAAVDTALVALSGLTIVPSAASQASLGWEHVARAGDHGCRTPQGVCLSPQHSQFPPYPRSLRSLWKVWGEGLRLGLIGGETIHGLRLGIVT